MTNPFISQQGNNLPPDLYGELTDAERARRYAEQLQQQSMDMPQGQQVGRVYVAPSWAQYAANALQAYSARKGMESADARTRKVNEEYGRRLSDTMGRAGELLAGKPESSAPFQADNPFGEDLGNLKTVTPAVAPDQKGAMNVLMQSGVPSLQQVAMAQMLQGMEPAKFGNTPHYDQQGRAFVMDERGNTKYLPGISARDKVEIAQSGVAYNPYEVKPGQVFNNPNNLMNIGPDGQPVLNQPLANVKRDIAKAGASSIVNMGSPQPVINPATGKPELVQFPNRAGASPKFTGLQPAETPKPPTESEAKAAFYAQNMQAASKVWNQLEQEGFQPASASAQVGTALASGFTNPLAGPQAQQARQAQNQWAEQMLRMQTGAAATKDEIARTVATYFPSIGDRPENVAQKRAMRQEAETGVLSAAGKAASRVPKDTASPNAPAQEGARATSKSGKPMIYRSGRWEYDE